MTTTPAASVVLVRDAPNGIEVFMLERHLNSDFVGGAYVFPGGKVDARDHKMPPHTVAPGVDPYQVAAARETFEEAGILLASAGHDSTISSIDTKPARQAMSERGSEWDWRPWLSDSGIQLNYLDWWAWWVTPEGVHRRFDTRFYIAELPRDQTAAHDNIETTDSMWVRPHDALARQVEGEVMIILPTRKILASLRPFQNSSDLMAHARELGEPERIEPSVVLREGKPLVHHPTFDKPETV